MPNAARFPEGLALGGPGTGLLLLIPAYNEEARIGPVLREFADHFREHVPGRFRIVVVLNGCVDDTLRVVDEVAKDHPEITAIVSPAPIGKGGALIEGLRLASAAELVGYVDADGATSPRAFLGLLDHLEGADCVVGSRWLPGAVLHREQPRLRRFASRCFHAVVQALFRMDILDTQCPAKVVRGSAVAAIHDSLRIADLAFDVNLLYSLKRHGYRVREVPTEWADKAGSKVTKTLVRSSLVMLLSVVRLRLMHSPLHPWLRPLRPLEDRLYGKLRAPRPRPAPQAAPAGGRHRPAIHGGHARA